MVAWIGSLWWVVDLAARRPITNRLPLAAKVTPTTRRRTAVDLLATHPTTTTLLDLPLASLVVPAMVLRTLPLEATAAQEGTPAMEEETTTPPALLAMATALVAVVR